MFKKYLEKKRLRRKLTYNDRKIKQCSSFTQEQLLNDFQMDNFSIKGEDVAQLQHEYGKNMLEPMKINWFVELLKAFLSPFNIILLIISAYNFYSYFGMPDANIFQLTGAIIVIIMVVLSSVVTYVQTMKSSFITKKLTSIVSNKATAIRNVDNIKEINKDNMIELVKESRDIDVRELVPGDLIYLSSGDMVPADVRVLVSTDLFINQSSLTGESLPAEKHATTNEKNLLELENICLTGTSVVSGSAICMVINTGKSTYFASISDTIKQKRPLNSFQKGIKRVTFLLIAFMIVMAPIVFAVYGGIHNDWINAITFAVSIAVGLTPEMLPMIITSNLARGAYKMSKNKVVVKDLPAIQNLGAIDVLCTDKTGTLTNDKIELVNYCSLDQKNNAEMLEMLYLNSYYQTGMKNPLDSAILNTIKDKNLQVNTSNYQRLDEIPFDFERRRLTIVVKNRTTEVRRLICKGAAEEISKKCNRIYYQEKIIDLTDEIREQIERKIKQLNMEGYRILALAYKDIQTERDRFTVEDESDLIFYGYASFLDIPKPSASHMVRILKAHGVNLKILTGDNKYVTQSICQRVGLKITGIISGDDLDALADYEMKRVVEQTNVFYKLSPLQKARIIQILKQADHIVGFMGDGINDAPVLRQSDVAISVDNATDIAKEASDIILLEKSLSVLEKGIVQGRTIFGNILKYIKITVSSNLGNVLSMLIASAWLPFQPMMPVQILFQNLLYDVSQFAIAADRVDPEFLKKPQRWETKSILPFAFINGPVSSIFDILTFVILGYGFNLIHITNTANPNLDHNALIFQSSWFLEGLITQTLVVQMLRTTKVPLIQSRAPWVVNTMTIIVIIIGFAFAYGVGPSIGMLAPSPVFIPIVVAIAVCYCLLSQGVKHYYIKFKKSWL